MTVNEDTLRRTAARLMGLASVELPCDVQGALRRAYDGEVETTPRGQMEAILRNVEIAHEKQVGLCQDTGVPMFFARLGLNCRLAGDPERAIAEGVREATKTVPLRQNVVNPLTKENSGTNIGWGIPAVHWEVVPGADYLELTAVPKGFGSEMRASQCWVLTSEDIGRAAVKAVLDVVTDAMGEPCPPIIIGVGVGGFADTSMVNAKKALFRLPIGSHNPDSLVASLETEILTAVNDLGLGPMGFGGKTYALAANVEIQGSHTAVVPVSVVFQCWACRYSTARLYDDGRVEYLTHADAGA